MTENYIIHNCKKCYFYKLENEIIILCNLTPIKFSIKNELYKFQYKDFLEYLKARNIFFEIIKTSN